MTLYLQNLALALLAFDIDDDNLLIGSRSPARDSANADYSYVAVVVECRNLHLQRRVNLDVGVWHLFDDFFEQRLHVRRHRLDVKSRDTLECRRVDDREV